ncbi:hypothetical protein MOC25_17850 [Bacillus subtilis]|uniref:hypothetical protein n=1 Tax=Bacillus subtilis TaxID=1423 RepID=UPI0022858EF8|nr:hypothetical protein [Bacillus subtilis]MCY8201506.1 hypothetical protein [Bacillus subtilis]
MADNKQVDVTDAIYGIGLISDGFYCDIRHLQLGMAASGAKWHNFAILKIQYNQYQKFC